jgi:hypothetical protein
LAPRRASIHERAPLAPQAMQPFGAPGDRREQEADRVAEQVTRAQRSDEAPASAPGASPGVSANGGGGGPLPASLRAELEPRFGVDFARVRVHDDFGAARAAAAMRARAFTIGGDIYFGAGQLEPGTEQGRRLIAHELAHVAQQSPARPMGGPVGESAAPGTCQRAEDWNFTPAKFGALTKGGGALKFDSDSSWFPGPFQKNLLDTLNAVLDPKRKKPATAGVNTADFFHGHIAMKSQLPAEARELSAAYSKVGESEYAKALGQRVNPVTAKNLPAFKTAVTQTEPSLKALLEAVTKLKDVVVVYHTFETNKPTEMRWGSPERNFLTPLGGSPKPYSPPKLDNASSWSEDFPTLVTDFNFLIDENGVIHVRPSFAEGTKELSTVTGKPEQ